MKLFAKLKKILSSGYRATLNFRKFKVALKLLDRNFFNFAKCCNLTCLSLLLFNKEFINYSNVAEFWQFFSGDCPPSRDSYFLSFLLPAVILPSHLLFSQGPAPPVPLYLHITSKQYSFRHLKVNWKVKYSTCKIFIKTLTSKLFISCSLCHQKRQYDGIRDTHSTPIQNCWTDKFIWREKGAPDKTT